MKKIFTIITVLVVLIATQNFSQTSLEIQDPQTWYRSSGVIEHAICAVQPKGLYSQIDLYLTFSAKLISLQGNPNLEVVLKFELPENSYINDLWLWVGSQISKGLILDSWTANSIYEGIVKRKRDPAILTKKGAKNYELRVYPILPSEPRRVKISYMVPNKWNSNSIEIQLPVNIFKSTFKGIVPTLEFVTFNSTEWLSPTFQEFYFPSYETDDELLGKHWKLTLKDFILPSTLTLTYQCSLKNNVYLKTFAKGENKFYQLVLFPTAYIPEVVGRKILFLVDNDSRKSNLTKKDLIENIKNFLLNNMKEKDEFNLFYSSLTIGKLGTSWIKCNADEVKKSFSGFSDSQISSYSNLHILLKEGYEYLKNNGPGDIYLISNSDQFGNYQPANQLINDLKKLWGTPPPTYILDYNDKEYYYNYFNNRSYIGNEYLYENLARITSGYFLRSVNYGSFSLALSTLNQKSYGAISSYDIYPGTQNGFSFSRFSLFNKDQSLYINQPYFQTGRFTGDFPFIIKSSFLIAGKTYNKTYEFTEAQTASPDSAGQQFWYNSYINSIDVLTKTNSDISEIVRTSIRNRILTTHTAFLSLEPGDTTFCKDCYQDKTIGTEIKEDLEIPTEFTIDTYPNPFNSQISITIKLPNNLVGQKLSLKIYNMLGQVVKTFSSDEIQNKNVIKLFWDGKNDSGDIISSGVYLFNVSGAKIVKSIKLMYMK